jgi:beta-mannosidase
MARLQKVSSYQEIPLGDGWMLLSTQPGQYHDPAQCMAIEQDWLPAVVPGTVIATLQQHGQWHSECPLAVDARDWWYRCSFVAPEVQHDERIVLTFEGLASVAHIWLNGSLLLSTENMFRSYKVDVTEALQERNELCIQFVALDTLETKKRPRARWRTQLVEQQKLRWIRTSFLGRMPGWAPPTPAVGPWRPVSLVICRVLAVDDVSIRTQVQETQGLVAITVRAHALGNARPSSANLYVGESLVHSLSIEHSHDGNFVLHGTLHIPDVQLWWPHTHGAQPLYATKLVVSYPQQQIELVCGQLAFRHIELLDSSGDDFGLRINGVPIFCRGGNWTPLDMVNLRGSAQEYKDALLLAQRAGMNMVRVGGTMVYEEELFYTLCDELGILVWQDFMFANMDYPFSDTPFRENCHQECLHILDYLQTHPCIGIICGNSEIEQQAAMMGVAPELWRSDYFAQELPELCRQYIDVPYWPSSPSGGNFPFQVNSGNAHYQGVGAFLRPFDDARRSSVRFATECLSFAHIPEDRTLDLYLGANERVVHHPKWKQRSPRDNGAAWDFDDIRDYYLEQIFAVNPLRLRYSDMERYLRLSRVVSGEVAAAVFTEWRRPQSTCHGGLVWLYRDLWPGAGWGIIDATGYPKAIYYYLRRAWLPQTCFFMDEGLNGLRLHVVNDRAEELHADVQLILYRSSGTLLATARETIIVPARGGREIQADALFGHFRDLTYAYRFGSSGYDIAVASVYDQRDGHLVGEAFYFPQGIATITVLQETEVGLQAQAREQVDGTYELTLRTQHFVPNIVIHVEGFIAEDNYFHMRPEGERVITLYPQRRGKKFHGFVTAFYTHKEVTIHI